MSGGDPEGRTPARAVKMHEFLMTGGVKVGEREGKATYSDPINHHDPKYSRLCPWHGEPICEAWAEIVAGRGYWTAMEDELAGLEGELAGRKLLGAFNDEELSARITKLQEQLSMRPRDAKALRERTPEMIAEERAHRDRNKARAKRDFAVAAAAAKAAAAALVSRPLWVQKNSDGVVVHIYCEVHKPVSETADADASWSRIPAARGVCEECEFEAAEPKPRVYAAAGKKSGGNPWDRDTSASRASGSVNTRTGEVSDDWGGSGYSKYEPAPTKPKNALADEAMAAFSGDIPDEIVIEGNEEDDD